MNNRDLADSVVIIIMLSLVFAGGWIVLANAITDPLDINKDGEVNITDLSVLAVKINERNSQ